MKILLDTNILVHAFNRASKHQKKAAEVIRRALRDEFEGFIAPQVLYEFYAVITNPKRVEYPLSVDEAANICLDLWECREIEKVDQTAIVSKRVFELVKELGLSGRKIFDCVLAVTARENGIEEVYTENVEDFRDFAFLRVLNPLI